MNRLYWCCCTLILLMLTAGCASLLQPTIETRMVELQEGNYELDKSHSTVLFKVEHMGLSTYVGRFNKFDASLIFDPENPAVTKLDAIVYTGSVDVNDAELANTLTGSDWFDSENFPYARFQTTRVEYLGEGNKARFTGDLTLHGVTAPITLDVVFNGGAYNMLTGRYTLGFSATTTIKRSVFGMDKYIPVVGDIINIEVYAEFQKR